ncbi:MAG: ATP-binding protein [Terracidiphilus sp.]|jgi:two-component system sensor histidine kinase CpxA
MRSLFFKIFVIFWIAQSLIFAISTALIVRHHFESPDVLFDGLYSSLENDARRAVAGYESGGCTGVSALGAEIEQQIGLKDATGRDLCNPHGLPLPAASADFPTRITSSQTGAEFIWRVPITSASGKEYVFLLGRPHVEHEPSLLDDLVHFASPTLPVAIVVGGLTTFVLVLFFTRPIVRLRKAARQLAHGNLKARVNEPVGQSRFSSGDEFHALLRDFNHMAERLESLVGAQQLLLRDVSHELRSPLARLSVALELAREEAGPTMSANLDRIERETRRLNQLIGQLLTLSSMEALDKIEDFRPVSLNRLIGSMIPDAEFEARQRECSIAFHADGDYTVLGNQELLYRAVENVVRNAIRYTESGSDVEISLCAAGGREAPQARIDVSDRGPGIPADQVEAVFRPFHRVDSARSPETGGFGVGLAIADRAVRLHKGEMQAFAREGGGVTIRMIFPAIEVGDKAASVGELHA